MAEGKESIIPADPGLRDETLELDQDKLNLYKGIIYRDATALLARYLPEAFPQEPTEVFIGTSPFYVGKFRDKHYISLERNPQLDPMAQALEKLIEDTKWQQGEQFRLWAELENERFRLVQARAEKGELDFEEIDQRIDQEQALIIERQRPVNDTKPQPHQDPEELAQGPNQYQPESWRHIYSLVHELIHQKQAELNPSAFKLLTSPELESIDTNTGSSKLIDLLIESHKAYNRMHKEDSLFYPVVEGMAALGAFYVMGRFVDELAEAGEGGAANRLRKVRRNEIRNEIINPRRSERSGRTDNYSLYYAKGLDMMRKLYKNFGLENIPQMLTSVDLTACQGIKKDSPEYQRIFADPAQLPGLQRAA